MICSLCRRLPCLLRQVLEIGALGAEGLELPLDRDGLGGVREDLRHRHLLGGQRRQHALLLRGQQEQQGVPAGVVSRGPAHAVDVRVRVLGTVQLHHPVDRRKVQPARRWWEQVACAACSGRA